MAFSWHLGGSILTPWGHPGRPWEQQEGHGGDPEVEFDDFGRIWGLHFESFSGTEGWKFGSVFGFVFMPLLTPIFETKSRLGILKLHLRVESNANMIGFNTDMKRTPVIAEKDPEVLRCSPAHRDDVWRT